MLFSLGFYHFIPVINVAASDLRESIFRDNLQCVLIAVATAESTEFAIFQPLIGIATGIVINLNSNYLN